MRNKKEKQKRNSNPKDSIGDKKVTLGLVPPTAIVEQALAFKDGAKKYGPYNWRKTPVRMTVYLNAALRHLLSLMDGEERTRDSNVRHEAAAIASLDIILDAREQGTLIDDRATKGKTADLLDRYMETNTKQKTKHKFPESFACKSKRCKCNEG